MDPNFMYSFGNAGLQPSPSPHQQLPPHLQQHAAQLAQQQQQQQHQQQQQGHHQHAMQQQQMQQHPGLALPPNFAALQHHQQQQLIAQQQHAAMQAQQHAQQMALQQQQAFQQQMQQQQQLGAMPQQGGPQQRWNNGVMQNPQMFNPATGMMQPGAMAAMHQQQMSPQQLAAMQHQQAQAQKRASLGNVSLQQQQQQQQQQQHQLQQQQSQQPTPEPQQFFTSGPMSDPQPSPAVQGLQQTPKINNQTPPRTNLSSPHGSGPTMNMQQNMMDQLAATSAMSNIPLAPTASAANIAALQQKNTANMNPQSGMSSASSAPLSASAPAAMAPTSPHVTTGGNSLVDKREKERVDVLLKINQLLVQAAVQLQAEGKGCDLQHIAQKLSESKNPVPDENRQFFDVMRCMQANLSYLAHAMNSNNPNTKKYNYPGPAIMVSPLPQNQAICELYAKLVELFDGWRGSKMPMGQQGGMPGASPNPNMNAAKMGGVGQHGQGQQNVLA